ncbi:hypothetical protein MAM1_0060c03784 [Mucor ambiguus]|uniref:Uncharacterized protein n=1 Tax=Mucor ambiguus TaxID=91626 RepID=A0A0C9MAI8_9FUNG|nr:hypothetical protein MAM1_0060c03784 [Mucor ambiguus]
MTSRKRSRDQVENDEAHQVPRLLTKSQIVHGLNSIWHSHPTAETHNALIDQFNDINCVYATKRTRRAKYKHLKVTRKSTVVTSLQDVAELEHKGYNSDTLKLPRFGYHPIIVGEEGNHFTSAIQHRYLNFKQMGSPTGLKSLSKHVRKYYLYQAMQEHEIEHGPMDEDFALSMVGNSCWTPAEKRKFFMAVERCSRGDVVEISRRVGPTKTIAEVGAYLNLLDGAAKAVGGYGPDEKYAAREMSDLFLMQETRMALILEAKLETESYAKNQELMQQESIQKSLELFEIWNFSSITRIFAEINDMTVLSSSLVQYHQLIKNFVLDILTSVYAELLDSQDKTVTRSLMNHVIAKRKETWTDMNNKKDIRLSNLDILPMIDKQYNYHKAFSEHRSASFLAKKRRMAWQKTDDCEQKEDENIIEIDCDDSDRESNDSVYDSEDDDMLRPFDKEDELTGQYISQDNEKQHYFESLHQKLHESIDMMDADDGSWNDVDWEDVDTEQEDQSDVAEGKADSSIGQDDTISIAAKDGEESQKKEQVTDEDEDEDEDDEFPEEDSEDEYDDLTEQRMQQLDYIHEQELTKHLNFVDADTILSCRQRRRW